MRRPTCARKSRTGCCCCNVLPYVALRYERLVFSEVYENVIVFHDQHVANVCRQMRFSTEQVPQVRHCLTIITGCNEHVAWGCLTQLVHVNNNSTRNPDTG